MKFCILGDLHLGARNDLKLFHNYFEKLFNFLYQKLEELQIDTIIQTGDLWDKRKYVNFNTLNEARRYFFDELESRNIRLITLLGNHDLFFRESVQVNSPMLLLSNYSNIYVCTTPVQFQLDNTTVDLVPWMCKENELEILEFIMKSKSDLCFGHFELAGFPMYKGLEAQKGSAQDMFAKYELVCSGHYHTRSQKDNIVYVGTPYEINWQDYNDPKGFHIFDTETRKLEFIENPYKCFIKLEYNDTKELPNLDNIDLIDCFVKLIVLNKTDLYKFDTFVQSLYNKGCYDIKILEDMTEFSDGELGEEINLEDTVDVMSNYIDSVVTDTNKDDLKMFMKSLYIEAINLGVV